MIIQSLKNDYKLIKKYFQKIFQKRKPTDLFVDFLGGSLILLGFATIITRRDLTNEGIIKISPFRYKEPNCIWHTPGRYIELFIDNREKMKKKRRMNNEEEKKESK